MSFKMWKFANARWAEGLWALALCLGIAACGEEVVSGAKATANDTDTATEADVAAAEVAPALPQVTGAGHTSAPYAEISGEWKEDAQRIEIIVWLGDFKDLLGIAGHLRYDSEKLQLTDLESLPLTVEVADSGFQYRAVAKEIVPGQHAVGIARFRTLSHPYAWPEGADVGRGQWLKLQFAVKAPGESVVEFDPPSQLARNSKGELLKVDWVAATVTVPATFGGTP